MKKHYLWISTLALGLYACSDDVMTPGDDVSGNGPAQEAATSVVETAPLKSFAASQSRVTLAPQSRAVAPGSLSLFAEIDNLSKDGGVEGFVQEGENGRFLSATSVYFDQSSGTYYVTYHMQGNNYNTTQTNETGGFIETFTLDDKGVPTAGNIYMAADPSKLSFDFNHLYFDHIPNVSDVSFSGMVMDYVGKYDIDDFQGTRVVAVGHKSEPSSKEGGKPNTAAIIAKLNFDGEKPTIDYATIYTGDKITDEGVVKNDGTLMPLGNEDAADANCVVRKYNQYYVATRKGIAALSAAESNMFAPEVDATGRNYFIRTPGSAKYLSQPTFTSGLDVLFLDQDTPEDGLTKETESTFTVAEFALQGYNDWKHYFPVGYNTLSDFSWNSLTASSTNKIRISKKHFISPVDGKNVMVASSYNTGAIYTCLGKNGLYVYNPTYDYMQDEVITFSDKKDGTGSRPVNCVFVEDWDESNGHHDTDGFIYVANGACLTILDAKTLKQVAEYSAFTDGDASANFVHVVRTNTYTNETAPDRIITVAYGQAGVKVFKFVPPTR